MQNPILKAAVEKVRGSKESSKINFVDSMTLEQLLEAEEKFLEWYPTTDHPDKETKKHIYENYMKKRIALLRSINTNLLNKDSDTPF